MMKGLFVVAGGSITGRNHIRVGQNNQDGYYSHQEESCTIAIACDGCGSCPHSEVGAKLGARLIGEGIAQQWQYSQNCDWNLLRDELLTQIEGIAKSLAITTSLTQIINDYFLFTVVGVIITPLETTIFSLGDGVIALNGEVETLGPFPHNAPPYLAYGLLGRLDAAEFNIHQQISTGEVQSILIGTDGVNDLIQAETCYIPGQPEKVGSLSQFWQGDRYFKNPDLVRRKLFQLNHKHNGLLPDDTTLIIIKKQDEHLY
jgi:hypothetical protein